MIKLLLLVLCVAASVDAQCPALTLCFQQRQHGPVAYPQSYAIGGTGNITLGPCSTISDPNNLCGNGAVQTMLVSPTQNADGSYNPTTTAPALLLVYWNGYGANAAAAGTHTISLGPIASTGFSVTLTLSLKIVANTPAIVTSPNGLFPGCTATNTIYYVGLDTCPALGAGGTVTDSGYPGNGPFALPQRGATYQDPNFGSTITALVPPSELRTMQADSTQSNINLGNTLVITESPSGHIYGTSTVTGSDVWDFLTLPECQAPAWSSIYPNKFYCYQYANNSIMAVTLGTPPTGWTISPPIYTFTGPGTAVGITNGGDGGTSKDEWQCWYTQHGTARTIGIINLQNGAVYSTDFSGIASTPGSVCANGNPGETPPCGRACTISKGADITSGNRFVVFSVDTGSGSDQLEIYRWKQGDLTLTDMGHAGQSPNSLLRGGKITFGPHCSDAAWLSNNCFPGSHSDTVEVNGHQYLANPSLPPDQPYASSLVFTRLDSPDNMFTTPEAASGDGLTVAWTSNAAGAPYTNDLHVGCGKFAPVCILETDQDPPLTTWQVTGATNNSPIHITATLVVTGFGSPTLANGDVLRMGGLSGNTALNNGTCVVANVSGSSFDCQGSAGNGAYTGGGAFIRDTTPVANPFQGEILFADATNLANKQVAITRLAKHRDWMIEGDQVISYYGQSHPVLSPDGTLATWESNFGYPDQLGIFGAATGYVPNSGKKSAPVVTMTAPSDGSAISGASVAVSATASPAGGLTIASIQFLLDGTNFGAPVTGDGPYFTVTLDSTAIADGAHTLSAISTDSAGNSATSPVVNVTVSNPIAAITAPAANATVSGASVPLSAAATAMAGLTIVSLQFQLDGVNTGPLLTGVGPFSTTLDSTAILNGPHTLLAIATDSANNSIVSLPVNITVSNGASPTVAITSPVAGTALWGKSAPSSPPPPLPLEGP